MANYIIKNSDNFLEYTAETSVNIDSDFPVANLYNYTHPQKNCRSNDTSATRIIIDLGSATEVLAVVLTSCNFDTCNILGDAAADGFGDPDFTLNSQTINLDDRVMRYKGYIALTDFEYRYLAVVPTGTPTDGESFYWLDCLVCLDNITPLTRNPNFIIPHEHNQAYYDNEFSGGGIERIVRGLRKKFKVELDYLVTADSGMESELNQLTGLHVGDPFIIYENGAYGGDSSKVYIAYIETNLKWERRSNNLLGTVLTVEEII